jgi:hypothetical protein
MKLCVACTFSNGLKNSEGDVKTLKMIQEVGGHQLLKIWKLMQKFVKWCVETVDPVTGGGKLYIMWETVGPILHQDLGKRRIYTMFVPHSLLDE